MKKKRLAFLVILLLPLVMFITDCVLAINDSPPFFAIRTQLHKDGGTSIYHGFGYKVIDYNKVDGRKDVVFKSIFYSKGTE